MPSNGSAPGMYVPETPGRGSPIAGVATSTAAFVGRAASGPLDAPGSAANFGEFEQTYGELSADFPMSYAVRDFFANGGAQAIVVRVPDAQSLPGDRTQKTGLYRLELVEAFNVLCIPPDVVGGDTAAAVYQAAAAYCADRRAMLIVDPPARWAAWFAAGNLAAIQATDVGIPNDTARHAAVYFPRVLTAMADGGTVAMAPCGAIAGVWAASDAARGVWKAPAGIEATLQGIAGLECRLNDAADGVLNPAAINCLRHFPVYGPVVWGARTVQGRDELNDDYKYIPIRRLVDYIENSILAGTQWAGFEPNGPELWSALRLNVASFLAGLEAQGALYGYTVSCDATTTTQEDIEEGVVNMVVSIAPEKPAEFLVIRIQQVAGQGA